MGREQIKVELVDYMGSDLSAVNSARVSFDKESSFDTEVTKDSIGEDMSWCNITETLKPADRGLVNYLANHNHSTPFRHNAITIRCDAPIFLARQLGKHQAGLSWNEVSRRYVDEPPEFFTPDEWRGRPEGSIKQGSGGVVETISESYWSYFPNTTSGTYADFISMVEGVYKTFLEEGVAPEMARMVLPQSMMTSWWWTGNLLAFAHVYNERIAPGAQLEANWFAEDLDKIIRPLYPVSWAALVGPLYGQGEEDE